MIELTTVFLGSLASVFLLGFNSQLVKDKNRLGAFSAAWLITLANMMYTKAFVLSASFSLSYIAAGAGGSIGIVLSIISYERYEAIRSQKVDVNLTNVDCEEAKNV